MKAKDVQATFGGTHDVTEAMRPFDVKKWT